MIYLAHVCERYRLGLVTLPPISRPRRRDAAANRAAILAAAVTCLRVQPDATLQVIADAAGLTRRALYGHFATREHLIAELVVAGAARVTASLDGLTGPDAPTNLRAGDSRVAIARMGSALWSEVADVRVMARLAVRGQFVSPVAQALAPVRQELLAIVTRGVAADELRQDISPELLSRLVEGAALAVLDETTRTPLTASEGSRLVMQATLAMAGLSWTETAAIVEQVDVTGRVDA
jgi:AcrR family transcriptional regulator